MPGKLILTGAYTQGSAGTFSSEIGGTAQGSQYDFFSINGNASLDGIFDIALLNAFQPTIGQQFQIISYGSNTGNTTFANAANGGTIISDGGFLFTVLYQSNGVFLTTSGELPEPGTLGLIASGLLLPILRMFRRKRGEVNYFQHGIAV